MGQAYYRARFYVPGESTAARIREAIALIEFRYNLSAWLYVDRDSSEQSRTLGLVASVLSEVPRSMTRELALPKPLYSEVTHAIHMGQMSVLPASSGSARKPSRGSYTPQASRLKAVEEVNATLVVAGEIPEDLQLRITGIRPVGSVNIGTEGLGEPLKEVVRSIWSRRERAEDRRHREVMNRQKERAGDLDLLIKQTNHVMDSVERIRAMMRDGTISAQQGDEFIGRLINAQHEANRALTEVDVQYVDRTVKEIER